MKQYPSSFYIVLTSVLLSSLLWISCSDSEEVSTPPQEIRELAHFEGNESADTVIVNIQGGPTTKLLYKEFDEIVSKIDLTRFLRITVHQFQTKNPALFTNNEITFEKAIEYDAESIEMLTKVITHFKNRGSKVYVVGISFGAFVTQELLSQKGLDIADKYLIMVGRLDINEVFWKAYSEGKNGEFTDGVTPKIGESQDIEEKNMTKLAAGLGRNRYTEKWDKFDDLSQVTYIYGKKDEAVGRLTSDEVTFLESKNVTVIEGPDGHSETINNYIAEGFRTAFGIE